MTEASRHELVALMAENRVAFLSFLERRVGHRETAEDLLQESFARSLDKVPLEPEESVTAWFYRVLRNGVIDHYRRMGVSDRALGALQRELDQESDPGPDERDAVCRCVARLSETLKPEYALALRRVEVDGLSVQAFASEAGITANNAGVRLFRARETLRKRVVHWCGSCADRGCVDCSCGEPGSSGCAHGA
ncbi:MAG TPA: sigma-70 family RNA polymerase sigma factor [Myxococcaceae bacterium]|nr:sigma-70 family RNA polymerase sigma factor [Myxococcaceae bacterium]